MPKQPATDAAPADQAALDQRELAALRDLLARDRIADAVNRYCHGIDRRDAEIFLSAFTEDAVLEHGKLGTLRGHQELATMVAGSKQRWAYADHFVVNLMVDLDGPAKARGRCHALVVYTTRDGLHWTGIGRYDDEYRREGDAWKIHARRLAIPYYAFHPETEVFLDPIEDLDVLIGRVRSKGLTKSPDIP